MTTRKTGGHDFVLSDTFSCYSKLYSHLFLVQVQIVIYKVLCDPHPYREHFVNYESLLVSLFLFNIILVTIK